MVFADLPQYRDGPTATWMGHIFDRVCREHGIAHRLTKPYHPWTNGQAERMNRTVKDATVKVFPYPDLESLKAHVLAVVTAYNFAKHLKRLQWRTPFQAICEPGPRTQHPSRSTRTTSSRDHTPRKLNKGSPPQAAGYFRRAPVGSFRVASGTPSLASWRNR
jgi:transposase InsO family protein